MGVLKRMKLNDYKRIERNEIDIDRLHYMHPRKAYIPASEKKEYDKTIGIG